ncbi:GNAT family N-acetyltransferase [Aquibacillus koreensis]|uniref:GNAT family N-acetyltransferase n=1 Tax=Aquibacillus koreensis TaxID=279446 RepID=A0A9X4AKU8_9BACI|nr:GNAT family N-acetyltransferase [Aquibacillus koreensis]MCT2534456.1 GNAT family N-acetyltransferase [Aquibacillus koreensis]MDC3421763.1 GNAT family N-acetyltransferase [Aquibacillus koreensis]
MQYLWKTERLAFREMDMEDVSRLQMIFDDPVAMKYYPNRKNKEETVRWIVWNKNNYRIFGVGLWIVECKYSGLFLGQCGLVPQKVDGKVEMEVGYLFVRDHWGKGYATEAAQACVDYGLHTLRIGQLISLIDPANEPSIKVAKRIGMQKQKMVEKWEKQLIVYAIEKESDVHTDG